MSEDVVTPHAPDGDEAKAIKPAGNRGMGRKKGSKNKSTLLREALTNDFEEQLSKRFNKVIGVVLDQAEEGCRQSQKLLFDRVVPTIHAESDKEKNPFAGGISITISSMETDKQVTVSPDIVDAEYETIEEED